MHFRDDFRDDDNDNGQGSTWQQQGYQIYMLSFDDSFGDVDDDDVYDVDDGDHLLVEVDGTEASSCSNDAEQVEDPVELNF